MSKMKKLQPQMEEIKKKHEDDPPKQQQEMMALYQREKINPLAGCLPILVQIPVFYAALQGAVRHHRDAPRAVLRLDPRPVGARPDHHLEPVRPDPLGPGDRRR